MNGENDAERAWEPDVTGFHGADPTRWNGIGRGLDRSVNESGGRQEGRVSEVESDTAIEIGQVEDGELNGVFNQTVGLRLASNRLIDYLKTITIGEVEAEFLRTTLLPSRIKHGQTQAELLPAGRSRQGNVLGVGASVWDSSPRNLDDIIRVWCAADSTPREFISRARSEPQIFDGLS